MVAHPVQSHYNFRSKTTAMILCFLFGLTGVHWFYLGRPHWGGYYLAALFGPPVVLFWTALLVSPLGEFGTALGAIVLVLGWLVEAVLLLVATIDFFRLLSMDPRRFDALYNG